MKSLFNRFLTDESGASAIEYGLIAAIIGVGIITSLTSIKSNLVAKFTTVADNIGSAGK